MANYNSSYTGSQVDASVAKTQALTTATAINQAVLDATKVVPNDAQVGTETVTNLSSVRIGTDLFAVLHASFDSTTNTLTLSN